MVMLRCLYLSAGDSDIQGFFPFQKKEAGFPESFQPIFPFTQESNSLSGFFTSRRHFFSFLKMKKRA
ncbi:MAG: hypothetical protein COA93_03665 [Alphaproteobacteria bacterium]|nr:MAG: hypothetical protein COA93_03665 [Alphaproteobacteria bacterium]